MDSRQGREKYVFLLIFALILPEIDVSILQVDERLLDMINNGKDPAQKLQDLHQWIIANKVQPKKADKPVVTTKWATQVSPKAAGELSEFQDWIRDIQTPKALMPTF